MPCIHALHISLMVYNPTLHVARLPYIYDISIETDRVYSHHIASILIDLDAFSFELIEEVEDERSLTEREGFWIREMGFPKGNYAIPLDGDDWTISDEFRESYLIGENNPNHGKKWTDEMKSAASERMKGRYDGKNNPNFGNRGIKNPLTVHVCPYETADELKDKLKEVGGFCALANELGISRSIVQNWCGHFDIPYKKRDYCDFGTPRPPITREEFIELHRVMTYAEMADHFGIKPWGIQKWRKWLDVDGKR